MCNRFVNLRSSGGGFIRRTSVLILVTAVFAGSAYADPFTLGSAATFAVFGFGSGFIDQLQPGALTVNGNVGVGQGGNSLLGGANVVIAGQLFYADPITSSNFSAGGGPISINGSTFSLAGSTATQISNGIAAGQLVGSSSVAVQAKTDELNMYAAVKDLSATAGSPTGALTSDFTWTGNGGTNVAHLSSFGYSSGDTLTLDGGANDFFIFNITGGWSMSGSSNIVLNGGVSSDHVLFNLLETADGGTGADATASGSSVGYGILFGLDRNLTMDLPGGVWNGRLFSDTDKTIHLFSEATINSPTQNRKFPPESTPEPNTLMLLGTGLAGLAGIARRRNRK